MECNDSEEYVINNEYNDFYFPRTERWILDTFGLDVFEAVLYQMILNKGYVLWTYDWMGRIMGSSESTIKRIINRMVDKNILYRVPVRINGGCRIRNILITVYTHEGKRPSQEVNELITKGRMKIKIEYEGNKR